MEQLDLKIDIVTTELITPKGIDIVQILDLFGNKKNQTSLIKQCKIEKTLQVGDVDKS